MNIYQDVEHMLMEAFNAVLGPEDAIKIDQDLINVEPPRDKGHGDVAINVAMVFVKRIMLDIDDQEDLNVLLEQNEKPKLVEKIKKILN